MSSTRSNLIDLTLMLHHQTEGAILVSDDGERSSAVWLPKVAIEFTEIRPGIVEVTLTERLATDKGLV